MYFENLDAAARKAALRAELKYIDIESNFKAELLKVKTSKKMEIAGAEQRLWKKSWIIQRQTLILNHPYPYQKVTE